MQGEKKSLSVAIMDEFYIFDLVKIHIKNLSFKVKNSTHYKDETFPKNHRLQPNSSLEKWKKIS